MESNYPLVSIIVPIYNTELYLEECFNSIIKQTYTSLEIILINDGSTDRSSEIIQSYAEKDNRIISLSQSNQGVSAARNAGLRVAKGEYILFVDSDDTIESNAVEILYRRALLTNVEIVIGNVFFCYPDRPLKLFYNHSAKFSNQPVTPGEQCFTQFVEAYSFPFVVYLYFTKRDHILKHQLYFEEGIVHEDELWCVKTLIYAPTVSVLDFNYYYYRIRKGSLIHSNNKEYRIYSFIKVSNLLEEFAAGLQERQEYVQTIGFVYVLIFHNYSFICKLLHEMNEELNEHKEYFGQILRRIHPSLSLFQQIACLNFFIQGNQLLYGHGFGLTLSFCVTCKNRLFQIKQTLAQNLEDNREHKDFIEFILVDFGSTDGLQEWISENFMNEIEDGYLKYYYTEELPLWHTSIAKNTSHILANNDVVVNLDCDNFTGKNGGLFVLDSMIKYGWYYTILHQFGNEYNDGSHGRIAISKSNYLMLGGYDESFEPAGFHDNDLLLRAQLMRLNYINLPDANYCKAILNTHKDAIANTSSNLSREEMDERNFQLSVKNITSGKLKANSEKDHIGIVDNIYAFD